MKKLIVLIIAVLLVLSATVFAMTYPDVPSDAWYAEYVNDLSDKGVINGYDDGTYKPSNTLTYGEFMKLIMTSSAPDVKYDLITELPFEHWAAPYIKAALNYGVIDEGEITSENINSQISRMEVVKILSKCDIMVRENMQKAVYQPFTDIGNISDEEFTYLTHAIAIGVINGYEDNTFKPENKLTRAEAAKILYTYTNIK